MLISVKIASPAQAQSELVFHREHQNMRVAQVCSHNVAHIGAAASVREAAEAMRKRHAGSLVVVDEPNGERIPIGIITDRDIVLTVVAPGIDPEAVSVADVMTRDPATCSESQSLFDAIETMRLRGVRRLPVLNAKGGLMGVIAADDIYAVMGIHLRELGQALSRERVQESQVRS